MKPPSSFGCGLSGARAPLPWHTSNSPSGVKQALLYVAAQRALPVSEDGEDGEDGERLE